MRDLLTHSTNQERASSPGKITIFADGLFEPRNSNGFACWGWAAIDADGQEIASAYGCVGRGAGMSNNVAEYTGLIEGLKWADEHAAGMDIELLTDSQLAVNQVIGEWECRAPHLIPLCDDVRRLLRQTKARLRWIPREQNTRADELTRIAYREARKEARKAVRQ